MKNRSYKELEYKPAAISEQELEAAKLAFLASGGTVQRVDTNEKQFHKQRESVKTHNFRVR